MGSGAMKDKLDVRPAAITLFPGASTELSIRLLHGSARGWERTDELALSEITVELSNSTSGSSWQSSLAPLALEVVAGKPTLRLTGGPTQALDLLLRISPKPGGTRGKKPEPLEVEVSVYSKPPDELRVRSRQVTLELAPPGVAGAEPTVRTLAVCAKFPGTSRPRNVSLHTWLSFKVGPAVGSPPKIQVDRFGTVTPLAVGDASVECGNALGIPFAPETSSAKVRVLDGSQTFPLLRLRGAASAARRHLLLVPEGFVEADRAMFLGLAGEVADELIRLTSPGSFGDACAWVAWAPGWQRGVGVGLESEAEIRGGFDVPDTRFGVCGSSGTRLLPCSSREPLARKGVPAISAHRWNTFLGRLRLSSRAGATASTATTLPVSERFRFEHPSVNEPVVFLLNDRRHAGTTVSPRESERGGLVSVSFNAQGDASITSETVDSLEVPELVSDADSKGAARRLLVRRTSATLAHELGHFDGLADEYGFSGTLVETADFSPTPNVFLVPTRNGRREVKDSLDRLPWAGLPRVAWAGRAEPAQTAGLKISMIVRVDPRNGFALLAHAKKLARDTGPNLALIEPGEERLLVTHARYLDYTMDPSGALRFKLQLASGLEWREPVVIGVLRDKQGDVPSSSWSLISPATQAELQRQAPFDPVKCSDRAERRFPPRSLQSRMRRPAYEIVAAFEGGGDACHGIVHATGACKMNYELMPGADNKLRAPAPYCFVCEYLLALRRAPEQLVLIERRYPGP